MSQSLESVLADGYKEFRRSRFAPRSEAYEMLAREGQAPRLMVVSCCDSRVDPEMILAAEPGEMFVVRNVANLVPPADDWSSYHGTSAALEFAVKALKVEMILVLGHSGCGGVRAALEGVDEGELHYIGKWLSILQDVRAEVLAEHADQTADEQAAVLEHASITRAIQNLMSFDFVEAAVEAGTLTLAGGWFNISDGTLHVLDNDQGHFTIVNE